MKAGAYCFIDEAASDPLSRGRRRPALFLDRDGVINVDRGYVHTAQETSWIPGIFSLCRRAVAAGYLPIVVTNQAGIARGLYSEDAFLEFTQWLHREFRARGAPLLATYFCPHHATEGAGRYAIACGCRKPMPGMFEAASRQFNLDMPNSIMVGDKVSDLCAARTAGVDQCYLLGSVGGLQAPEGTVVVESLDQVMPGAAETRSDRDPEQRHASQ